MQTVLIAHHDSSYSEELTAQLRAGGFHVINCPGPWPPALRCIRCDVGYCPLTESADVMIYDPDLTGIDNDGRFYNLAVDSAQAHPDVPLLLAWPSSQSPAAETLISIFEQVPTARIAAHSPEALAQQIRELIAHNPLVPS